MRNGNSWRLLPLSVPVADTEGGEKEDRLELTEGTFRGRQSRKGTATEEAAECTAETPC